MARWILTKIFQRWLLRVATLLAACADFLLWVQLFKPFTHAVHHLTAGENMGQVLNVAYALLLACTVLSQLMGAAKEDFILLVLPVFVLKPLAIVGTHGKLAYDGVFSNLATDVATVSDDLTLAVFSVSSWLVTFRYYKELKSVLG